MLLSLITDQEVPYFPVFSKHSDFQRVSFELIHTHSTLCFYCTERSTGSRCFFFFFPSKTFFHDSRWGWVFISAATFFARPWSSPKFSCLFHCTYDCVAIPSPQSSKRKGSHRFAMDGSFRSQKTLLIFIQSCWWTSEVSMCKCSHLVAWKITRGKLGRMVWAAGKGLDQPYTSSRWATATAVGSRNPWPHRLLHLCQSNRNRGWLLLPKDRLCWYYPGCLCSSVLCQCTQVFLQAIYPHAHQGEEPQPWLPGCRGQKHGQKAGEWSRCKNLKLSCCQISVSTGFVEPKPCLTLWSVGSEIASVIPRDVQGRSSLHIRHLPVKAWGHHLVPWMFLETSEHILSTF